MPTVNNIISYYINSKLVSSSKLGQPPDTLTEASLTAALAIVIKHNIPPNTKVQNATAIVTQGKTVLIDYTIEVPEEPP